MYLDQTGLLGLWDRMKAVFAGKSDVSKSEQKLSSKGLQLVANGTGITGDNTNFSHLTYDATKSSGMSSGSFTYAKGKRDTISTDDYVPLTTGRDYRISFDLMSDGGNATAYGCIFFYDADKHLIESQDCMYIPGSTTKLARDLKKGDTEVYFESLDGWKVTDTRVFSRSIIFWDYANSFGYTYPPETYSRYHHDDLYADNSAVDKAAKKITLSKPWAFEEHKAGTTVSQNESGATFKYFGIHGTNVPTEWTTYEEVLKGEVDYSGTNVTRTIPPGTAYARPGFLWNHNLSGDQLWMTNLSLGYIDPMTEDGVNASREKLPAWSGYPRDNTQLIRRDNGGGGEWGRVTFLTVWNYIKGKVDALYAPKASPAFTGNPTAPTPSFGDSSKSLATTEFVANAITRASAPTDYIVAQGKCDFWTWRMWKSGVAECWGSTSATYEDVTSEWGYLYEGSAHSNGFPGNTSESSALAFSVKLDGVTYKRLFKNVPEFCSCSFNPTGGTGISGIEIGGGLSALSTPTVFLLRPTPSGVDGHYSYCAKGRWK